MCEREVALAVKCIKDVCSAHMLLLLLIVLFYVFDWQLLLEERLNTGSLSREVGAFVELLWTEALGCLSNILTVSVNKLSLNDVRLSSVVSSLLFKKDSLVLNLLEYLYVLLELLFRSMPHLCVCLCVCVGEQGGGLVASGSEEAEGGKSNRGGVPPG